MKDIKKTKCYPSNEESWFFIMKYFDIAFDISFMNTFKNYVLKHKESLNKREFSLTTDHQYGVYDLRLYTVKSTDIDECDLDSKDIIVLRLSKPYNRPGLLHPDTVYLLYTVKGDLLQVRDNLKKESRFLQP